MKSILSIKSSANNGESISMKLANAVVARLTDHYPDNTITERDLVNNQFPHLDSSNVDAFFAPLPDDSPKYREATRYSDAAIREVQEADILVIAVPMYNFTVPSALKAWIDHVVRVNKTFAYNEQGIPYGLLKHKKAYLAISSGSVYTDGPYKPYDFTEPYLRAILSFIGITDISAFRAEGVALPGLKEMALQKGIESIAL